MTEGERFEEVCKPWLERIEKETREKMAKIERDTKETTAEILRVLKGHNGDPGLVDDVRLIMKSRADWGKLAWILITVTIGQAVVLLFTFLRAT